MQSLVSSSLRPLALILATLLVAGCSGGGRSTLPPSAAATGAAAGAASASGKAASAAIRITIPAAQTAYAKRHPQYVSPGTQSITIAETGAPSATASLSAASPNCTTMPTGRTCTITYGAVSATNATFTVKLFGSTDGSGTALATQSIVKTIVTGTTNEIDLVLNGVVSTLSVALANPNMTVGQAGSTTVVVNALDASGYVITGPGVYADANGNAVTVTLVDSDTSGATHLAQTSVTAPTTIAFTYNGASIAAPHITASAPSLTSASATLALTAPGAVFNAAQVSAALASTEATFAAMPHTNIAADLTTLAAQMVSSGAYASATVTDGGISAILPDGTHSFVAADHAEDFTGIYPSAIGRRPIVPAGSARHPLTNDPLSAHQVVLLTNSADTNAFFPNDQLAYSNAWNAAITGQDYGVSNGDMTLDNVLTLGGAQIDVLDIATHGGVANLDAAGTNKVYTMASTTPVTAANNSKYAADILAGNIFPGVALSAKGSAAAQPATYFFTPAFLAKYLKFNNGAIFFNNSCFGQSPDVSSADDATLKAAGVGRYFGWTKAVGSYDADQTDAFIIDRLLGEDGLEPTGLDTFVTQRVPAQRPFPLDDIQTILSTEMRDGPFGTGQGKATAYDTSDDGYQGNAAAPPAADGTAAHLVVSDYGGETVSTPPIEYAMPAITNASVSEGASGGTLTINGHFPAATGTVLIVGSAGAVDSTVTAWSTTQIVATIPVNGPGAAGQILVQTASGQTADEVPLTQWTGTLKYTESDEIPDYNGKDGSGAGSMEVDYALDFRADVHPVVPAIDTTPAPQAFVFPGVEADSTANWSVYQGSFASADGKSSATFSLNAGPALTPKLPPLQPGTFEVRTLSPADGITQPSPCNSGTAGLQGPGSNIACPITGAYGNNVYQCSDTGQDAVCGESTIFDNLTSYGVDGIDAGGLLEITMDPKTYGLTVSGQQISYASDAFGGAYSPNGRPATANMTGTFSAPKYPPAYGISTSGAARRTLQPAVSHGSARTSLEHARAAHRI